MAARPVLVVVVIADAALRTMVTRRLAMQGVELLSSSRWDEQRFAGPAVRPRSVLIIDNAAAGNAESIERQSREGLWRQVVILTEGATAANDCGELANADCCAPPDLLRTVFADGTYAAAA